MNEILETPIHEIIFLLKKLAPEKVEELKSEYPEVADQIITSKICGAKDQQEGLKLSRLRGEAVIKSLQYFEECTLDAIEFSSKRIIRNRQIRLSADVFTFFGTSSFVGLLGFQKTQHALYMAIIVLISNILKIVSEFMSSVPTGKKNMTIQESYEKLSSALLDIRTLRSELNILVTHSTNTSEIDKVVRNANSVCRSVNEHISELLKLVPKDKNRSEVVDI